MDHHVQSPEPWVTRFAPLVQARGTVLDLACGAGRHGRHFIARGHPLVALYREVGELADLRERPDVEIVAADVEGGPWPLGGRTFAGIVVVNYLHRPLLPMLAASLASDGVLIYQTFGLGNERFGRPSNPDFLLKPNELLDAFAARLTVVAYEAGEVTQPRPAVVQRLCAINRPTVIPPLVPAQPQ